MTARDRSTLLRMAGNVAAGIAALGDSEGRPFWSTDEIAERAVTVALRIFNDRRLWVEGDGGPATSVE